MKKPAEKLSKISPANIINVEGEVNKALYEKLREVVLDKIKDNKKPPHVMFVISSPGGAINAGLDIYDLIKSYPGDTTTLVFPFASSAASTVLQAGKQRLATPNARLLFHNPIGNGIKFDDVLSPDGSFERIKKEFSDLKSRLHQTLVRINLDPTDLDKLCIEDRVMYPEEALRIGAIDGIVENPFSTVDY